MLVFAIASLLQAEVRTNSLVVPDSQLRKRWLLRGITKSHNPPGKGQMELAFTGSKRYQQDLEFKPLMFLFCSRPF